MTIVLNAGPNMGGNMEFNSEKFDVFNDDENQWTVRTTDKYNLNIGYIKKRYKSTNEIDSSTVGEPVYRYFAYPLAPFKSDTFNKHEQALDYIIECFHKGNKRRKDVIVDEIDNLPEDVDELRLLLDSIVVEHCSYFDLKVATDGNKWTIHGSRWENEDEWKERIKSYENTSI